MKQYIAQQIRIIHQRIIYFNRNINDIFKILKILKKIKKGNLQKNGFVSIISNKLFKIKKIMETTKKETLIKVLESLVPYWSMAEWFLTIVKNNEDNRLNDALYEMITKEIKEIKVINDKAKINNIKEKLKKIKEKEGKETKEYKYLEDLIDNL